MLIEAIRSHMAIWKRFTGRYTNLAVLSPICFDRVSWAKVFKNRANKR